MTDIERFRAATAKLISLNPSTINITKKVYSDDGSGGTIETSSSSPSFTGRIFKGWTRSFRVLIQMAGLKQQEEYELLAPYDAEIAEASENVKQSFAVDGVTYEITNLIVSKYQGEIITKRAVLTKVK